jgi:hypothetical protein
MLFLFLILAIVTVTIVTWNLGVPFLSKLRNTKDGFIFRTKFPTEYRFSDRQEEIDELASRLESPGKADRQSGPDNA